MAISKATASSIAPAAKGDLVAGSATNDAAVLAVGADDTVLTADSSEATGLKWAAASGGGMTLLSTTATTSGASVTISGISGSYKNLLVIGTGITSSNNTDSSFRFNSDSSFRFNSNTSSVYSAYNINYINTSLTGNVSNSTLISGSAVGTSTAYSDTTNFTMNIYRYSEASEFKNITIYSKSRSTVDVGRWTTASFGSNTAISSITYTLDAGTLATGNIYIYGVS
jgi:trimeric autotransporter adhesin